MYPSRVNWLDQLGPRFRVLWPAKMIGTTFGMTAFFVVYFYGQRRQSCQMSCLSYGMTAFFVVYFWLLKHPFFPPTTMPLTAVDRLIGFRPEALPLYLSLWIYVSLAPAFLTNHRELISYGVAATVLSTIGLGIFLLWPTAVPQPEIDWSQHPTFFFLKSVDASGNACPSLHVAFAVFTAVWFERILREISAGRVMRALNWLWCLGILYSTVAIRQHVSLDVLAGAGLGLGVAAVHLRWLRVPG